MHLIYIHRVQIKRCHWFFRCNLYKYRPIFIIVVHNFAREFQSTRCKNFLSHVRCVATALCKNPRHNSNTFYAILALCTLFWSNLQKPLSIKWTKNTPENCRFKISIHNIHHHMNTCTQATMPLRNRCRDDGVVQQPPLPQQTFFQLLHIKGPRTVDLLLKILQTL